MLETLLLIAVVGCIAHLASIERRLKRLEQLWIEARPASGEEPGPVLERRLPGEGLPARGPVLSGDVHTPVELAESGPGEQQILYAASRPEDLAGDAADAPAASWAPSISFEELFGRRLPIWAGGITLAVAGMLIVKLSIEAGLLSPLVRVVLGLMFGILLIGGAELALRKEEKVRDERVRQALSGAGIASLYASVLVASNLYQLVGPLAGMLGMAVVTALAIGLSLRFGPPCALLGLAGGLAAPALIGSEEPNVPLLSLYLALAVGGLCTVSRGRRWAWLGLSALLGGFGWGLALMLSGALDAPGSISVALYLLLLGVGLPMLGFAGNWQAKMQLAAAVLAAAQMAALVATGGFDMLHWALFAMISLALLWLSRRLPELDRLPPIGLLIALLLLGAWPDPRPDQFALVLSGTGLIYGVPALRRLWGPAGTIVEAGQLAAIALGGLVLPMFHFYPADGSADRSFGLLALGLAVLPMAAGALGWNHGQRRDDARFAIAAISSALLASVAASLLLPGWLAGAGMAGAGLALLCIGRSAQDARVEPYCWVLASAGLVACFGQESYLEDPAWQDMLQWGLMAAVAAAMSFLGRIPRARAAAEFLVPLLLYAALAPLLPNRFEPLVAPVMLLAMAGSRVRFEFAGWAALMIVAAWAFAPVGTWLAAAGPSLLGDPVLLGELPEASDALLKLVIPASILLVSLWLARGQLDRWSRVARMAVAATLAVTGVHSLYKLLLSIGSNEEFIARGLAERTIWEWLLLAGALLSSRLRQPQLGLALVGAAALHFTGYSIVLHNPLATPQSVGPWPVFNLVPASYLVPVLVLLALPAMPALQHKVPARAVAISWMVLLVLFSATLLRQLFHGDLLVEPGLSQMEDIARSILAIALAIGFLLWGIWQGDRDWRIGSLVLMVGAVAKVFLWDTSGLEGWVRIASFIALGFSLIGIGWLYSRQLAPDRPSWRTPDPADRPSA